MTTRPSYIRFAIALLCAVLLTLVAAALTLPAWFGIVRNGQLHGISKMSGHLYVANMPDGVHRPEGRPRLRHDFVSLAEDETPLLYAGCKFPDIEQNGGGRYRVGAKAVYFSSSDGTPPDTNGRSYVITVSAVQTPDWVLMVLGAMALAAWCFAVWCFWRSGGALYLRLRSSPPADRTPYMERFCLRLSPVCFFGGIVIGFLACVMAGYRAGKVDVYADRSRFFEKISPLGYVYPTLDNFYEFVRGKARPGQILILVVGSSRMVGQGQTNDSLWSKELQDRLGPKFAVVNIGFRAARFTSLGMPMLAALSGEYPHSYLVGDAFPFVGKPLLVNNGGDAGNNYHYPYDYVVWQSWVAGKLNIPSANNIMWSLLTSKTPTERTESQEAMLSALFERITRSGNLWNYIGYFHFFTVYNFLVPGNMPFWIRRSAIPDDELPDSEHEPIPKRFDMQKDSGLRVVGDGHAANIVRDSQGHMHVKKELEGKAHELAELMPIGIQPGRVLLLLPSLPPHVVNFVPPEEQERYEASLSEWATSLDREGFQTLRIGQDFDDADFWDVLHFSNKASPEIATNVAASLQEMAKRDGWLK